MGNGTMNDPPAFTPVGLSLADLLRLADAFPLLDRLALLVTVREGGNRETIIFGILGGLQAHLDGIAPAGRLRGIEETIDAIRGWFDERIAKEEGLVA